MVDEKLGIDTKQPVQQFLIIILLRLSDGTPGNIAHGIQPLSLQLRLIPLSYTPEIPQRPVIPQKPAVAPLVQRGDPHSIFIRRNVFGYNVHSHLAQIQIGSDSSRRRDSYSLLHVQDHFPGQFFCSHAVSGQIVGHIHHHLVDRIHVDVLRGNVF